jgi:uncharacterized protein (TIGR03437 family)
MRLHFEDFGVEDGQLWALAPGKGPEQRVGPFTGMGPSGTGQFWTVLLPGETVEVHYLPASGRASNVPFSITEAFHAWKRPDGAPPGQPTGCFVDEAIYDNQANVHKIAGATAVLDFYDHSCSGILLNDKNSTTAPFLLTAGHCIEKSYDPGAMVAYFQGINGGNGDSIFPSVESQVLGASLLAKQVHDTSDPNTGGVYVYSDQPDFALLLMNDFPLGTITFAGWSSETAPGEQVFSISHPWGLPQSVAFGSIDNIPAPDFVQVLWSKGSADRGSSGAGIVDSQGEVVGVASHFPDPLSADKTICTLNVHRTNATRFGAIYPAVSRWLEDQIAVTIPPAWAEQSIVDAASNLVQLVPGSLATIYGKGFTSVKGVVTAQGFPLPYELGGVTVDVNGTAAPLLAVAGLDTYQQINFQIPWDIGQSGRLIVSVRDSSGKLVFNRVDPQGTGGGGIFRDQNGYAAALHNSDYRRVTPADPALPGEVIAIFGSGFGPTTPQVANGQPSPLSPLAQTSAPAFFQLGDVPIRALFTGLAPGYVGLYQINFIVPPMPPGDYPICTICGDPNPALLQVGASN